MNVKEQRRIELVHERGPVRRVVIEREGEQIDEMKDQCSQTTLAASNFGKGSER